MATEEELNNQRDLNEEILKSAEAYAKLKESQQDILFFTRDYADEAKKASKEVLGSTIAASQTAKAFRDVASAAKKITDNYSGVLTGQKQFSDLQKEGIALEASKASLATEYAQVLTTIGFKQAEINSVINEGVEASAIFDAQGKDMTANQMVLLELFEEQNQQLQDEAANMAEIAKRAKTIDDAMRPLGESALSLQDMGDGLSKGLSQAGLGDLSGKLGIGDAISGARETAAGLTEGGTKALDMSGKLDVAGGMAKTMGKNLMKALGPAALIAMAIEQLVDAFKLIDGASGEVAKGMGVSAKEGRALVSASADAAAMSGDLLQSTKDVVAAQMSLNKEFGTSVAFSGELASEFASISERTGLSEKAMGMFTKNSMAAGTSIKDQLQEVTAITQEMSAQSGIMLNSKDIQEGIAELSAVQQLNAGRSTEEMARQVFQAKLLGASQSQLESASSSLLDFESSIGAEMEAELLTGKQLNLEAARAAALAGDQGKLAEELAKNMGTSAEFGAMNAIQQEKLAAAMGMTKEDMAGMLLEQENLEKVKEAGFASQSEAQNQYNAALKEGKLTEELKNKLSEAGVLNQMESATAADKMNAAMEKITDLFVQLMDPLMPIIDALMAILDPIFAILSPIMKLIGDLVGLIMKVLMPSLNYIQSTLGGLAKILTGIFTLDFGMIADGFKGMLNGVITMFDSAKNMLLDVILAPLDGIINLMNLIPGVEIPDVSTSLGEATELPQLAKGGVVTGPTQAIIGEGSEAEAVLPLSKLANMLPSGVAIGDSILNAATAPMRGIMNTIGSIFDQGDIGDALKNPISGLMDTIGGMFNGDSIIDKVSNVATAPLRGIMDTVGGLFGNEDLGDIIKNPISGLMDTVDGLFSNIKSPISGLMDTVGGMFDGGSSPVSVLSDAIGGIFDNDIGDTLLKTITAPMRAVGNLIPSEGVSSAISSFEEDPTGSIGSVFDSVKENISNVLGGGDENKDDEQLKSLNEKMSQLISLIEKGGDVYIDGAKAGKSMVLATSRMG